MLEKALFRGAQHQARGSGHQGAGRRLPQSTRLFHIIYSLFPLPRPPFWASPGRALGAFSPVSAIGRGCAMGELDLSGARHSTSMWLGKVSALFDSGGVVTAARGFL